jgi:hypothetical protein
VEVLLNILKDNDDRDTLTVEDLSQQTCIQREDVISTLQYLGLMRYFKGKYVISITQKVISQHEQKLNLKPKPSNALVLHPELIHWCPADFTLPTKKRSGPEKSSEPATKKRRTVSRSARDSRKTSKSKSGVRTGGRGKKKAKGVGKPRGPYKKKASRKT